MSASVREPDHGPSKDEPLKYAPKKARLPDPEQKPASILVKGDAASKGDEAASKGDTASQSAPQESAEPPWRRSRQRGAFIGDVAIAELRTKLALAPDRLPEPPPPSSKGSKLAWAGWIVGVGVVAAVGFVGYRWGSSPSAPWLQLRPATSHSRLTLDRSKASDVSQTSDSAQPAAAAPNDAPLAKGSQLPSRQLTVAGVGALQMDEVARLTISAADVGAPASVVIGGLTPGSALSAGKELAPNRWQLSVDELAGVTVTPPRGFTGVMDLTLELRLTDNSVLDRRGLRLEWAGRSGAAVARAQSRQHDAAEIAQMVKRGADLMANGDVAAARLMYQRAAEAGEAVAAFALAETYDPLAVAKGGIPPDVGLAHFWYEKAKDLGSTLAPERLERLARLPE